MFRCPSCTAELDRDIDGARNILLRYLTVTSKEPVYAGAGTFMILAEHVYFLIGHDQKCDV